MRITLVALACAFSASWASAEHGSPALPQQATKTIYATLPAEVHVFWKTVEKGIEKAAEEHGYQTLIRSAHDDQQFVDDKNTESRLTRFLVDRGAKIIIIAPSQSVDTHLEIPKAEYVFAGRGADKFTLPYKGRTLVAIDSYEAGKKAALALRGKLPAGAKVGVLDIDRRIVTINERVAGFVAGAKGLGFKVIFSVPILLGIRESQEIAKQTLESHPDVRAVFTPNELTTLSTMRAISTLPRNRRPLHVGFDFRREFAPALRSGDLLAVVVQDPFLIGYKCAETVIALENGHTAPKQVAIDTFVVDGSNLGKREIQDRLKVYFE